MVLESSDREKSRGTELCVHWELRNSWQGQGLKHSPLVLAAWQVQDHRFLCTCNCEWTQILKCHPQPLGMQRLSLVWAINYHLWTGLNFVNGAPRDDLGSGVSKLCCTAFCFMPQSLVWRWLIITQSVGMSFLYSWGFHFLVVCSFPSTFGISLWIFSDFSEMYGLISIKNHPCL